MAKSRLYFGGLPTEIELTRLTDAYGVPEEGWAVAYVDVAPIIGAAYPSARFRTVTTRWRKRLYRDHNVLIGAGRGHFTALAPSARLVHSANDIRSGVRRTMRGRAKLLATDRQRLPTPEEQREYDHAVQVSASVEGAARLASKRPMALVPAGVAAKAGG